MYTSVVRRAILLAVFALALTIAHLDPPYQPPEPLRPQGPPRVHAQEEGATSIPRPEVSSTPTPIPAPAVRPTRDSLAGATPTSTPTPTPAVTPIGSIDIALPPLTEEPSAPGTVTEGTIGPDGGQISSRDGRVSLVFPRDATSEVVTVRITVLAPADVPPLPSKRLIGAWNIEAFAPSHGMAKVDQFNSPVTLTLQFGSEAMSYINPRTLELWRLDNGAGKWLSLAGQQSALRASSPPKRTTLARGAPAPTQQWTAPPSPTSSI
jgi:hypothetical protein